MHPCDSRHADKNAERSVCFRSSDVQSCGACWYAGHRYKTVSALPPERQQPGPARRQPPRSEEHTSELQSLMRISYAVFCLKKKNKQQQKTYQKQKTKNTRNRNKKTQQQNTKTSD